jgi:hypothetical protein
VQPKFGDISLTCPECSAWITLEPWTMRIPHHDYPRDLRPFIVCPLSGAVLIIPLPIRLP